jgi:hypothetical protein
MQCKYCQKEYTTEKCGSLDAEECRDCMLTHLDTGECPGNKFHMCDKWNCRKCFTRSWAAVEWCDMWDYESNDEWPIDVPKFRNVDAHFKCTECNHRFISKLSNMARKRTCKYCSSQELCEDADCATCHDKSVASSSKAHMWHSTRNCPVTARQVFKNSNHTYWFKCGTCNHDFDMTPNALRVGGGPYCAHRGSLCKDHNCAMCRTNSFATSPRAVNWHSTKNGDIEPRDVFIRSSALYWFTCASGHEFQMSPDKVFLRGVQRARTRRNRRSLTSSRLRVYSAHINPSSTGAGAGDSCRTILQSGLTSSRSMAISTSKTWSAGRASVSMFKLATLLKRNRRSKTVTP